jgi:hypothetical protein
MELLLPPHVQHVTSVGPCHDQIRSSGTCRIFKGAILGDLRGWGRCNTKVHTGFTVIVNMLDKFEVEDSDVRGSTGRKRP